MKKVAFLSSFWIKIFAIVFMTLDHLGMYFVMQYPMNQTMIDLSNIFRIFGRLSLPLFIFLIAEGVRHTRSIGKYLLKLGHLIHHLKPLYTYHILIIQEQS